MADPETSREQPQPFNSATTTPSETSQPTTDAAIISRTTCHSSAHMIILPPYRSAEDSHIAQYRAWSESQRFNCREAESTKWLRSWATRKDSSVDQDTLYPDGMHMGHSETTKGHETTEEHLEGQRMVAGLKSSSERREAARRQKC